MISFDKSCLGCGEEEGKGIPLLCKEIVFKNKIKRNILFIYFYFVPNRCPLFNLQLPAQWGDLWGLCPSTDVCISLVICGNPCS